MKRFSCSFLIISIFFLGINFVLATDDFTYHVTRYEGQTNSSDGTGTTCYWSVIPFKYKPHIALADDSDPTSESHTIRHVMTASKLAQRNDAIIAVNMGFWSGVTVTDGEFKWNPARGTDQVLQVLYMGTDGILHAVADDEYDTSDKIKTLYPIFASTGWAVIGENNVNNYGRDIDKNSTVRTPRTFIGQDSETLDYFVGVCSGRKGDGDKNEAGLNYYEIYDFVEKNITSNIKIIINVDGGGSSSFVWNGEKLNYNTDTLPYKGVCDEGNPSFDASLEGFKNKCIERNSNQSCKNLTMNITDPYDETYESVYCKYERMLPSIAYWKEDSFYFKPLDYVLNISNNIISKIEINTSVAQLTKYIYTNGITKVLNKEQEILTDTNLVKTGDVCVVTDFDDIEWSYAISVRGDVLGEGNITLNGIKTASKQIIDNNILQDEYLVAADYNNDGQVKMNDVMKILNEIKKVQ